MSKICLLMIAVMMSAVSGDNWECKSIDTTGIIVEWSEKYGPTKKERCIGLWYNNSLKKYRLTWAGSKFIELPTQNINSIKCVKE